MVAQLRPLHRVLWKGNSSISANPSGFPGFKGLTVAMLP
jgi:hypothetical protein